MKDGIILTILVIVWTVIKLVFKLLAVIVKVLAALIIFFGLYIPLFYSVFGIILLATTDFTLGVMGTNQVLFFIGLGLCGVAALIISIRNLIVRPLSAVFAPFIEYRDEVKRSREERKKAQGDDAADGDTSSAADPRAAEPARTPYAYDPAYYQEGRYGAAYPPREPYDYRPRYAAESADPAAAYGRSPYADGMTERLPSDGYGRDYAPMPERPLIYYSKRRPGILVKEYSDRFELFEEVEGTRRYIGTEYKDE